MGHHDALGRYHGADATTPAPRRKDPCVRIRRTAAAVALSAFALGGLAACGGGDDERDTTPTTATTSQTAAPVPTAEELTGLLNQASDPAVPVEQKVHLVEGGAEAPELFDQIAALKQQQGADVTITGVAEGDIPGTLIANAVIAQPGQENINVQAQFVQLDGHWQLQKSFACALITNAGLQAPATCAPEGAPAGDPAAPPAGDPAAPPVGDPAAPPAGDPGAPPA